MMVNRTLKKVRVLNLSCLEIDCLMFAAVVLVEAKPKPKAKAKAKPAPKKKAPAKKKKVRGFYV